MSEDKFSDRVTIILARLGRIKKGLWIAIGIGLATMIALIAVVALIGVFIAMRDKSKEPKIVKNQIGMEFVSVPAGSFMMGSDHGLPEETPPHQVTISKPFLIGRYEVTQGEWKTVTGREATNFKGSNFPAQFITWSEIEEFLARLNQRADGYSYRLPTEAEWEYACRAGTTGNYADELEWLAWYANNSDQKVHPVGYKHPNAWGIYDMHGNVAEYCQDWYQTNYYAQSPATDPPGPANGTQKVLRGGSFFDPGPFSPATDTSKLRAAARNPVAVNSGPLEVYGFRIVAVAK
jgi:formylglycine-generating enzyme required for sulfatase activity